MGGFLQGVSSGVDQYSQLQSRQTAQDYQRALMNQMAQRQFMDQLKFQQEQELFQQAQEQRKKSIAAFAPGTETRPMPGEMTKLSDRMIGNTALAAPMEEWSAVRPMDGVPTGPMGFKARMLDDPAGARQDLARYPIVEGLRPQAQQLITPPPQFPSGVPDPRDWAQTDQFLQSFSPAEHATGEPGRRIRQGWEAIDQAKPYASGVEIEAYGPGAPIRSPIPTPAPMDLSVNTEMVQTPSQMEAMLGKFGVDPRTIQTINAAFAIGGPDAAKGLMDDVIKQIIAEDVAGMRKKNKDYHFQTVEDETGQHLVAVNKADPADLVPLGEYGRKPLTHSLSDMDRATNIYSNGQFKTVAEATAAGRADIADKAMRFLRVEAGIGQYVGKPLHPSEAEAVGQPYGVTPSMLMKLTPDQRMVLSPKDRDALVEVDKAKILINDIAEYAKRVPDVKPGMIGRAVGGAKNYASAIAETNPDAKMLRDSSGFLSNTARALGQTGVLTDQDINMVDKLLPSVSDTMEVRMKQIERINEIIDKGVEKYMARITRNFPKETQKKPPSTKELFSSFSPEAETAINDLMSSQSLTREQAIEALKRKAGGNGRK